MKSPLELLKIQNEMETHFRARTMAHIGKVQTCAAQLANGFPTIGLDLMRQVAYHDETKFAFPEFFPYLHITWKYKMEAEGEIYEPPQETLDKMHEATMHHIRRNKHHPEFHDPNFDESMLSKGDRDSVPAKMVNAMKMDRVSIAEMVCDWVAMSQEKFNRNDATEWANMNINKRWKFTEEQVEWIWEFHEFFQK